MADTPDPFASAKRRVARAKEHIAKIVNETASFYETKPYARLVEKNARGFEEHKVKLTADIPAHITDLAYEAIEALRASLDQAAYQIAVACGSKRPDLVHFPISDNAANFENLLKGQISDFPAELLTLFRTFKPYKDGNDLLFALNRVRRQAAHRFIVPVATCLGGVQVLNACISSPHPMTIPAPKWDSTNNEIILVITGPGSNLEYTIEMTFFLAFGPTVEGLSGESVSDTLEEIATEVERIVLAVEAEAKRIDLIK
jgi:hypothetical protein